MSRIVFGIVGIILVLILGGSVLPGVVDETASDTYSEPFSVTTGGGETTTNETLSYDNYYTDLTGLTVLSDNVADTPIVMFYHEDTNEVEIWGLAASDTRTLAIGYYREAGTQFYGFGGFIRLLPFLVIVGGVIACVIAIYTGIKKRE
jgi:multisubunit Na+/H+ antiporter MnhB subunit